MTQIFIINPSLSHVNNAIQLLIFNRLLVYHYMEISIVVHIKILSAVMGLKLALVKWAIFPAWVTLTRYQHVHTK